MKRQNEMKKLILVSFLVLIIVTAVYSQEIFDAIRNGDLAKVKELVDRDPSTVKLENQDHDTPLHMAALMDNEEMAKYLIEKGADLDALNGSLYSPLMRAGLKVAKVLVRNGADINYESANGNGSALTASLWQESKEVAEYLLDCGAKLPDKESYLFIFFLAKALQKGSLKYLEECLKSGFDPLTVSESQNSLLHYAAESNSVELMEKIIILGVPRNRTNIYGWTPLHVAAYNGNKKVVEFLVHKGLDKNRRTIDGHSPYNLAVEAKKPEVVDYLKSLGADQNPQEFPELKGGYMGQPKPGKEPVPIAPGIIATRGSFHSSVTFSPDNKEAFWTSGRMTFHSRLIHGRWTKPVPHHDISSGDVPFISPDGEKLYFLSQEKGTSRYSKEMIGVMDKTSTGWSDPYLLPDIINSIPGIHYQLSVDRNRNLYFGARQNGTVVSLIYYSEYKNGNYSKPIVMDNLKEVAAHSPFISPDGGYLIITAARARSNAALMILFRKKDGTWTKERDLTEILGLSGACPIVTPDGKYLFFRHVAGEKGIPYWVDASFIQDLRKDALKDDE
jgi:ankyrin repeat protein